MLRVAGSGQLVRRRGGSREMRSDDVVRQCIPNSPIILAVVLGHIHASHSILIFQGDNLASLIFSVPLILP